MQSKNSYVYIYRVDQKPIYVGISTNTEASKNYTRAKNLNGHEEVAKLLLSNPKIKIEVSIVSSILTKMGAKLIETILMQQFINSGFEILNKVISTNRIEANNLIIKGNHDPVIKRFTSVEKAKNKLEYEKLVAMSPLHEKELITKEDKEDYYQWEVACLKLTKHIIHRHSDIKNAKLRKELHRKTVGAKLRAAALHTYLFMYSKFYGKMKNSKAAVYKFKKTGSSKLESELIKLADLEIKYKKEHTQLLKDFNIEYAEKINIS